MRISRRVAAALVTPAALAGSALTAGSAVATPEPFLLKTSLAPSIPSDPMLHGVTAGGAPWKLKRGFFALQKNGQVRVNIRGLIIPELGSPGPVTTVDAALYCGSEMEKTAAFTTPSVPISKKGNALIEATVSVPSSCLAPVVLIEPNGISSIYITTSGFML
ncbi:MAG TPA: hypothetical protein VN892_00725 [Solirubrobacteraceae bacterium]|nr:hypothetical protein [Solirubrobacteraceae bacterium]